MAKKNYDQLAEEVIEYVGGKDNVTFFTHCITRLRFNVKDQSKVNEEELKKVQGVLGCQWISGQFQIIIGQQVDQVYDVICKIIDEFNPKSTAYVGDCDIDYKFDDRVAEACKSSHSLLDKTIHVYYDDYPNYLKELTSCHFVN